MGVFLVYLIEKKMTDYFNLAFEDDPMEGIEIQEELNIKEIVDYEISKLQRLNYNRFFWWRNFAVKQKPQNVCIPRNDKSHR